MVEDLLFLLLGLLFGSFFNVVGLRLPLRQSIVYPPSHCPGCQRRLGPYDLIPIFSYVMVKGKCRYCQEKISPLYPMVEGTTGILFLLAYEKFGWSIQLLFVLLFIAMLMIITVSDLVYQIIPDKVLLPFFLFFLGYILFVHLPHIWVHFIGMILGFLIFYLLAVISRGGMGGGDIKLYTVAGLALGYPLLFVSILLSTVTGSLFGLGLMLIKKEGRKSTIPFGPFIAAGSLISIFWGEALLQWYWGFIS